MAEITRQVGASSDDCRRGLEGDYWSLTTAWFAAGYESLGNAQMGSGGRFTNITIPQGYTIVQAYLTLRAFWDRAEDSCNTRISAENVDDAPTFANDKAAFDLRWANRTIARVDWDAIPAWTDGVDYNSPEIKTVIQEIVNRAGWASGQAIVIFWEDYDDRSTHGTYVNRIAKSYNSSTSLCPKLVIEYTPPPVGWTGKVSGVTNPAKIMGVAVANIAKVKGVA